MPYVDLVDAGVSPWCGETWRDVKELVASVSVQHQAGIAALPFSCGKDLATDAPFAQSPMKSCEIKAAGVCARSSTWVGPS